MEESRSGGVDRARKEHKTVREDIGCESKDSMAVNTSVLEVDSGRTVSAYDDLQLKEHIR